MTDKPKPSKAPSTWRGKPHVRPGMEHYGDMREPVFKDTPGKRLVNWLMTLLTPWQR